MSFADQVKKFVDKYDLVSNKVYRGSCQQVSVDIAEGTPVSTGRLLGSWSPSVNDINPNYYSGGKSAWVNNKKVEGIADQNKAAAMSNLKPRINSTVAALTTKEKYYFTNSIPYVTNAEHEGWQRTDASHMRENAILNWQAIVNNEAAKV